MAQNPLHHQASTTQQQQQSSGTTTNPNNLHRNGSNMLNPSHVNSNPPPTPPRKNKIQAEHSRTKDIGTETDSGQVSHVSIFLALKTTFNLGTKQDRNFQSIARATTLYNRDIVQN